jgi:uncharacterized protein
MLIDRLADRVFRLPGPVRDFRVERGLRVPLNDGVTLAADHYVPSGEPAGTLLVRGPYGLGFPFAQLYARPYAARGYHVLFVASRGTAASEGDFDPMRTERADGREVVAWLVAQPWFTGKFATIGPSYLGYTQWALLEDPPPQMAAAVVTVGPHDFAWHSWGTGAMNLDLVGWSDMMARAPRGGKRPNPFEMLLGPARRRALKPVFTDLPIADAAERHYAGRAPWFRDRVTRPDLADPYWEPMRHGVALDRVTIPMLLLSGWQDLFLAQTIQQYAHLRDRGVDVALTVGPWAHSEAIGKGSAVLIPQTLDWLAAKMSGQPLRRPAPVHVQVTGTDEWRDLPTWPPPTRDLVLHLRPGGGLGGPEENGGQAVFTFDPARPTPALGGPMLDDGGCVEDSALAARGDVLAFTGDPLPAPLEVHGRPVVTLRHGTDNPHADLWVRLSEVDARGHSRNVTEGYRRLPPDRERSAPVRLELLPTAHRFAAGSRLRLLIAGGCYPHYMRNLGTAENPGTGSAMVAVRHHITLGDSAVSLPVVS